MRTILLTGKDGQIGWELQRTLLPLGRIIAVGRRELDLTNSGVVRDLIRASRPDIIVNAAAYTAVDQAERETELALSVNAAAPRHPSRGSGPDGSLLVHYSTDYIFDGAKREPYIEDDPPHPLNAYGRSKLAGEEAIRATEARHLIFRTSWVYGSRGKNFMRTILRLAEDREELRVVADQFGAPTWSRLVAGRCRCWRSVSRPAARAGLGMFVALTTSLHPAAPRGMALRRRSSRARAGYARISRSRHSESRRFPRPRTPLRRSARAIPG